MAGLPEIYISTLPERNLFEKYTGKQKLFVITLKHEKS